MLPERTNTRARAERRNIPTGVVIAGVLVLAALAVFGWVALGINTVPDAKTVTVDVPVRL